MRIVEAIKNGGKGNNVDLARRCQDRLKDVFNHAIAQGWMKRGQNPAIRHQKEKLILIDLNTIKRFRGKKFLIF